MPEMQLLSSLRAAVKNCPTGEKILVVSAAEAGRSLVHRLVMSGTPVANLRVKTPAMLAKEAAEGELAAKGVTAAGRIAVLMLAEELLDVASRERTSFFEGVPQTPGLVSVVAQSLTEIRLAGLTSEDISPDAFDTPEKGEALLDLLRRYEEELKQRRLADSAIVFRTALTALERGGIHEPDLYMAPVGQQVGEGLTRLFLEKLTAGKLRVLERDLVRGIPEVLPGAWPRPEVRVAPTLVPESDVERLSWLYAVEEAPAPLHDETLQLFHGFGVHNEIREAFRRMRERSVPWDQVELVAAGGDVYLRAIYEVASGLGVPCTFASGLPVEYTRAGRGLASYLEWVQSGFAVRPLWQALADGTLVMPDAEGYSGSSLAQTLRVSAVGWGRGRYDEVLAAEEQAAEGEHQAQRLKVLRQFTADLLGLTPEPGPDGRISLAALCRGAALILADFVPEEKAEAGILTTLTGVLREAAGASTGTYSVEEAVERLRLLVLGVRTMASGPEAGCVWVTDLETAGWSGRGEVFLLGLGEENFPGSGLQDPILLDHERARLSGSLPLAGSRPELKRFQLAETLAGLRGRLTISYNAYDHAAERAGSPSAMILQLERLRRGDPACDYTRLMDTLGIPVGFIPPGQVGLDTQDWWLKHLAQDKGGLGDGRRALLAIYPNLNRGLAAEKARNSQTLTTYDGVVGPDPSLDPRQNPRMAVSASRLEMLAGCPLRYYFRYVLGVEPPEEVAYDRERWLDSLQKGSLFHEIYCDFLMGLRQEGMERPERAHGERLKTLAEAKLQAMRELVPPPSELIFAAERERLLRSCDVFLQAETVNPTPGIPRFFEVGFGTGEDPKPGSLSLKDPVRIQTASGQWIRFRGRIDRIDDLGGHRYEIWDYKTGRSSHYGDKEYFKRGRLLQHALYAVAAETMLRQSGLDPEARVISAGYYFPTTEGEGRRWRREQDRREELGEILDELCDLAAQGLFVAAEDKYHCGFCEYTVICGGPQAAAQTKEKIETPALETWRRLQNHE